jgi:hypothetical protein
VTKENLSNLDVAADVADAEQATAPDARRDLKRAA